MKKITIIVLVFALMFSLIGCSTEKVAKEKEVKMNDFQQLLRGDINELAKFNNTTLILQYNDTLATTNLSLLKLRHDDSKAPGLYKQDRAESATAVYVYNISDQPKKSEDIEEVPIHNVGGVDIYQLKPNVTDIYGTPIYWEKDGLFYDLSASHEEEGHATPAYLATISNSMHTQTNQENSSSMEIKLPTSLPFDNPIISTVVNQDYDYGKQEISSSFSYGISEKGKNVVENGMSIVISQKSVDYMIGDDSDKKNKTVTVNGQRVTISEYPNEKLRVVEWSESEFNYHFRIKGMKNVSEKDMLKIVESFSVPNK